MNQITVNIDRNDVTKITIDLSISVMGAIL